MASIVVYENFAADLVEVTRPPNWPDLISVVKEADAGLSQAVTLSNFTYTKACDKLLPYVRSEATSCCQPNTMSFLLQNLEPGKGF